MEENNSEELKENVIDIQNEKTSENGIKIANDVIVRASMRELTDENAVSKPYLLYSVNSIVLCRVISIYKNEKDQNDLKINVLYLFSLLFILSI